MGKQPKRRWKLDPEEVSVGYDGLSIGREGVMSRKNKITGKKIKMTHRPTKITLEEEIPPGHYSKKEMRGLSIEIEKRLFDELEERVARELRIKGL